MPELSITVVPVSDLCEYEGNAKEHPREQVDQIATSITEFGNCDPIGVWHDDAGRMVVVEGHGRLMALKQLGIEEAPVVFLDHLTDEQRRAYALVHNQLTMNSGFDFKALNDELDAIVDINMEDFGFSVFGDEQIDLSVFNDAPKEEEAPEEFEEFGDDIKTTNRCPKCGFEW